jgi:hypothetical protein
LVEYQPETTPRRSDSSVLTWRGERSCMECFLLPFEMARTKVTSSIFETNDSLVCVHRRGRQIRENCRNQIALMLAIRKACLKRTISRRERVLISIRRRPGAMERSNVETSRNRARFRAN